MQNPGFNGLASVRRPQPPFTNSTFIADIYHLPTKPYSVDGVEFAEFVNGVEFLDFVDGVHFVEFVECVDFVNAAFGPAASTL
jgi:hypothetical protein